MNDFFSLTFPGNQQVSNILAAVIRIGIQLSGYVLILHSLRFYVRGKTRTTRIIGMIIGALIGVFAAKVYTYSFLAFFPHFRDELVSAVLLGFVAINGALTATIYVVPTGGPNAASSQNP